MIGLAVIVLLIGIASAIFSAVNREQPIAVAGAPKADTVANLTAANSADPANEPLAELGVAPGASETNAAPAAKAGKAK